MTGRSETISAPQIARNSVETVIIVAAAALFFATVPLSGHDGSLWWLLALAVGSTVLLGVVTLRIFARGSNMFRLLNLFLVVVAVCALGFYTIAQNLPGEFSGINTRIDALYFTLTTMTTTGYGDIHAVGQLSRALVSLLFVFDLVFLGLVGAELSRIAGRQQQRIRQRAAGSSRTKAGDHHPDPAGVDTDQS